MPKLRQKYARVCNKMLTVVLSEWCYCKLIFLISHFLLLYFKNVYF